MQMLGVAIPQTDVQTDGEEVVKEGKKGGIVKSSYLDGCSFILLVWAYEHLQGTMLNPSKFVRFPQMFQWEDKKPPSNLEATLHLIANVTRSIACLDVLEKDFTRVPNPNIRRRQRKRRMGKYSDNRDELKEKGDAGEKMKLAGNDVEDNKRDEIGVHNDDKAFEAVEARIDRDDSKAEVESKRDDEKDAAMSDNDEENEAIKENEVIKDEDNDAIAIEVEGNEDERIVNVVKDRTKCLVGHR
ncbi:hypothetical protein AKJ16_DCAP25033 [Drosera capensis]